MRTNSMNAKRTLRFFESRYDVQREINHNNAERIAVLDELKDNKKKSEEDRMSPARESWLNRQLSVLNRERGSLLSLSRSAKFNYNFNYS